MQLRFVLDVRRWYIRTPQCGSHDGWSAWEAIDRLQALRFLELGWMHTVEEKLDA